MSEKQKHYIVCYDIADPSRLVKIGKAMKDYGSRVLMSVFECKLTDAACREMKNKMSALMDTRADSVRYYFICKKCLDNADSIGKKIAAPTDDEPVFI